MVDEFDQAKARVIAKLVEDSVEELDAWVARGTRELSGPQVDRRSAAEVMASPAPPPTPSNVSWEQVFKPQRRDPSQEDRQGMAILGGNTHQRCNRSGALTSTRLVQGRSGELG